VIAAAYGLTKSFTGRSALDNIDLEIKSGQVLPYLERMAQVKRL